MPARSVPENFEGLLQTTVRSAVREALQQPGSRELLSTTVDAFLTDKAFELEANSKHLAEYRGYLQAFLLVVGDKPVGDYTITDGQGYRNAMDEMPLRANPGSRPTIPSRPSR